MAESAGAEELDRTRREIDTAFGVLDAEPINLVATFVRMLRDCDPALRPDLVRYIMEHDARQDEAEGGLGRSAKEIKLDAIISDNELENLKRRLSRVVDGMFEVILDDKPEVMEVYARIWDLIENPMFRTEEEQAFAFYWVYIDRRMPYFEVGEGMRMSNADWAELGNKLRQERARIRFILATQFSSRSEEADLILRELDQHEDPERVRLMALVLWELREREREIRRIASMS